MNVTLLDTETGETRSLKNQDAFQWAFGDDSCDCNRQQVFGLNDVERCQQKRFIVTSATLTTEEIANREENLLRHLNDGYSSELLNKHLL